MRLEVSCTAASGVEVAWSPAPGGEDDVDLLQIEYTCRDMFDSNDVTMTDILLPNSQRISSAGLVPETSGRDIECTISGCYEDSWFASYAIPPVFHTCLNSPQPDTGVHIEPTNDDDLSSISSTSSPSIQPSSSSFLSTSHSTSSTVLPQASISVTSPSSIPMDAPYAALDDTWKLRISAFSSASVVPTSTLEFSSLPGTITAAADQGAFTGTAAVYDDMASTGLFLAAPSTTTLGTTTVLAVTAAQLGSSQTLHPTPLTPVLPQTRTTNEVTTKSNSDLETAVHVTALVIMVGLVLMAGASLVLTLAFLWHCYVKAEQRENVINCDDGMKEREKPARNTCQHFILIA